ncbi:MAG: hypothetical protein QOC98_3169 [Frankiaceae bacterium]|nr:hypothetical protein [Frankiaceae bacterium]
MSTLAPDRQRARLLAAAGAIGLVLVVVLTLAGAPTIVRTGLCLPLLIGIGGSALSATLVPDQRRLDGLTRVGLVLLLGLTTLLTAALLVALLFRDGLPATRLVIAQAVLSAVPLAVLASRGRAAKASRTAVAASTVWSGVAGVVLLALALVLGNAIVPKGGSEPTFSFTGPTAKSPGPTSVGAGAPVPLSWSLRNTGNLLPVPSLQAVIDGRPVAVTSDVTPAGPQEYRGTATLTAPTTVGVHRVVLSAPLRTQRLELVTYLDVRGTPQ